jgi:hypothetical protein
MGAIYLISTCDLRKRPRSVRYFPKNFNSYMSEHIAMKSNKVSMPSRRMFIAYAVIAAVALLSSTTITPVFAQPSYTQLTKATAATTNGALLLSVSTVGNIPRFPDSFIDSVLVFGYAWVNTNNGQGVVAAIHPNFKDSFQNPSAWHTHTVSLSRGTSTSNFCIQQLGTSEAGVSIINNFLGVNIGIAQAGNLIPNVGASFVVQSDSGCTATELGVKVLTTATIS